MKNLKKLFTFFIIIFTCLFFFNIYNKVELKADNETYHELLREYRAAWVSHFAGDISAYKDEASYKQSVNRILDNMQALNMNAIVFHVRTHNNAFYKSELNPKSRYYANVNFDEFDPVAWMIDECHKRGMEFHAWMNPYRVSTAGNNPDYTYEDLPSGNAANNPENLLQVGNSIILDPGRPAVRQFIVDTCMELIENYDVDAIHFDDYFYISDCDDSATREIYNTKHLSIDNFRREQVNLLIEALHNSISRYNLENNKAVEIGIAPSGVYRNGSYSSGTTPQYDENGTLTYPLTSNTSGFAHYGNYLYSDTKYWIDNEWIDYITPQSYHAIKQASSSFKNLTEWWSWCVRYKKVNLSMGIGIYMALENSSSGKNWKDADELYNQMMNANQYDEIHGLCFYKYASLQSSDPLMVGHVQTIKNLWKNYVPCPIKPQYTNLPEPMVKNVELNGTTLSWDKIDNVRGYVIFKVALNETIDKNNKEQFYKYITNNSLEIDNEPGYKYYVSSVNLANEFSVPTTYNSADLVEQTISMINQITYPITLEQKDLIEMIDDIIAEMSAEQIQSITNYDLFIQAKEMLAAIESIKVAAKELEDELLKDIEKAYLLPLKYGDYSVSWEYADDVSRNYYDLNSGNRLVEYLATTYANLKYTISKDGLSYSNIYKLNVGYTKHFETALFYRNTPHALNIDEDPTSTGSFIGWSGKVLKFEKDDNKYVFFIAKGNYHELIDSNIPSSPWGSCGYFYLNKSGSTITNTAEAFEVSTGTNYGYFIIGTNGIVKKAVSQASLTDSITLLNGEALYCVNYLDGLINDSVMKPGSKMENLKVDLITPDLNKELTSLEKINLINNEIDQITYPINLIQKGLILRAQDLVNGLTDEEKQQINITKLNDAVNKLTIIIDENNELDEYKETKKQEVLNYVDFTLYNNDKITLIENIISSFNVQIEALNTVDDIDLLVIDVKNRLDLVPTKAEEDVDKIDEARTNAINDISEILNGIDQYSAQNQSAIRSLINEYTTLINNENTCDGVEALRDECITKERAFKTLLEDKKEEYKALIASLKANFDYSLYDNDDAARIRVLFINAESKINKATSVEAIESIYNTLMQGINDIDTIEEKEAKLNNLKEETINYLDNYLDKNYYHENELTQIDQILNNYHELIALSSYQDEVLNYKNACIQELDNVQKDELLPLRKEIKQRIADYVSQHEFTNDIKVRRIVEKYADLIEEQTTSKDLEMLYFDAEEELSLLLKPADPVDPKPIDPTPQDDNDKKKSCRAGLISISLLSIISISYIIMKRRNR